MYVDIMNSLYAVVNKDFHEAAEILIKAVNDDIDFINTLWQIGVIPEAIEHDSSAEKLYSKVSDAVLARAFREIGLKSTVIRERADTADVLAESPLYGYTLVADAKVFRMSRTARNQKDFKVSALSGWRKDNDYAVLCAPYYNYPQSNSQIYAQALESNVCLLSWEHLVFLIEHRIKENESVNFANVWNFGELHSEKVTFAQQKKSFIEDLSSTLANVSNAELLDFKSTLQKQVSIIIQRAKYEEAYWHSEAESIYGLSREQAITELLKARKIAEKIEHIKAYVERVTHD